MDLADAKRLKELEKENSELKKMLAESMLKIRVLEEDWRCQYNTERPHSRQGYLSPEAFINTHLLTS